MVNTTTTIQVADREGLINAVRDAGLSYDQVAELNEALDQDAADGAGSDEPGPHLQRWWTRASIGTAKVTGSVMTGATSEVVARLIASYFGLH